MSRRAAALLGLVGACVALGGTPASAAPPSVAADSVRVGIGGSYKVGRWTPLRIDVTAAAPATVRMEIESVDPDGNPASFVQPDVEIAAGRSTLSGRFQSGRIDAPLRVRLFGKDAANPFADLRWNVGEGGDASVAAPLPQSMVLGAMLGMSNPIPTEAGSAALTQAPLRTVVLKSADDLSSGAAELESLDVLVLAGAPEMPPAATDAVREWVHGGGHLIVCVGADAVKFSQSAWQSWIPIRVAGATRLRELSGLEASTGKVSRIVMTSGVPAARLEKGEGDVRITGLDGPLLVRAPYGFGEVMVLGVDIDRAPLTRWNLLGEFVRKLMLGSKAGVETHKALAGDRIARQGLTDLSTQVHAATEDFPAVQRSTSWMVLGLIIGYVLLLGPLDYFFVHRFLKRPQLTWITFPLMAVLAAAAAVWGADRTNGDVLRVNQIDLVDVDTSSKQMRVTSWFSVYSPETSRYELVPHAETEAWKGRSRTAAPEGSTSAATEASDIRLCWDGIPEDGFGGMYRRGGAGLARPGYRLNVGNAAVADVPISIWSSKVVSLERGEPAGDLASATLESPGLGQLRGSFSHSLPGPLTDWVLAFGNRVYIPRGVAGGPPPVIPPGMKFDPTRADVFQRELSGFLTGATSIKVKGKASHEDQILVDHAPYDPLNRDPLDILRMVTFHAKSGGTSYTGLANDGLRSLEMSDLLDLNRAVLFGRLDVPASSLGVRNDPSGEPLPADLHKSSFVRIVFPVRQTGTIPDRLKDYSKKDPPPQAVDAPAEAEIPN